MKRKLKVSLCGTQLFHVFDERVVSVEKLHSILIAMMTVHFQMTDKVGAIEKITNNTIEYCTLMTPEDYRSSAMSFSLEIITE